MEARAVVSVKACVSTRREAHDASHGDASPGSSTVPVVPLTERRAQPGRGWHRAARARRTRRATPRARAVASSRHPRAKAPGRAKSPLRSQTRGRRRPPVMRELAPLSGIASASRNMLANARCAPRQRRVGSEDDLGSRSSPRFRVTSVPWFVNVMRRTSAGLLGRDDDFGHGLDVAVTSTDLGARSMANAAS